MSGGIKDAGLVLMICLTWCLIPVILGRETTYRSVEHRSSDQTHAVRFHPDVTDEEVDEFLSHLGEVGHPLEGVRLLFCPALPSLTVFGGTFDEAVDFGGRLGLKANLTLSRTGSRCPSRVSIGLLKMLMVKVTSEKGMTFLRENPLLQLIEESQQFEQSGHTVSCSSQSVSSVGWNLDVVDLEDGEALTDGVYIHDANSGTDEDIRVYVLDSGINIDHTDFGGRAENGDTFCILLTPNGCTANMDMTGHGTHVAGIIGANNYGMARKAKLINVKVMDDGGSASTTSIVNGLNWAKDNAESSGKRAVILLAFSGTEDDTSTVDDLVNSIVDEKGWPIIAAAGNNNVEACEQSPGRADNSITVSSVASDMVRQSDANYGSCVDIFAPGVNVVSLSNIGDSTATMSGTSVAAAHVAGAAAVIMSQQSDISVDNLANWLKDEGLTSSVTGLGCGDPELLLQVRCDSTEWEATDAVGVGRDGGICSSSSDSSSKSLCFSGEVTVWTRAGEWVRLEQLSVGTEVLTLDPITFQPIFQEVFMFGHHNPRAQVTFHRISTASGLSVEVTGDHMLGIGAFNSLYPARLIRPGHSLVTLRGRVEISLDEVTEISQVPRTGFYNPLTKAGTLLVQAHPKPTNHSDVALLLASQYADSLWSLPPHSLHLAMWPWRVLYGYSPHLHAALLEVAWPAERPRALDALYQHYESNWF